MQNTRAGIYVNLFCNAMAWRMAELFLPLLALNNSITEFEIGLFSTFNAIAMILFLIPAGILADSITHKKGLLGVASILQVIIQLAFPLAVLFSDFLLVAVLQGLTIALYTPSVLAVTTQDATIKSSGRIVSLYLGAFSGGMSLGAYLGGILSDFLTIHASYSIIGGLVLASALTLLIPTPHRPVSTSSKSLSERITLQIRNLIGGTTRDLRPLYIGILLRSIGFFSFYYYFPLYVTNLGFSNSLIGLADAINNGTSLMALFIMGYYVERIPARVFLLFGFYGHVLLTLIFTVITTAQQLLITMFIAGIIWTAMKIGTLTIITRRAPVAERGKQNSLESSAYNAGRIIGSPINGLLIQFANGFTLAYWFTGVLCLVGSTYIHSQLKDPPIPSTDENSSSTHPT